MHAYLMRWFGSCVLMMSVFLLTGCATKRVILNEKSHNDPRLIEARSGGDVTLAWDSKPNSAYTIRYSQTQGRNSQWRIVPGLDRIRGTGRRITYNIKVPVNETRYFRLHTFPAISYAN